MLFHNLASELAFKLLKCSSGGGDEILVMTFACWATCFTPHIANNQAIPGEYKSSNSSKCMVIGPVQSRVYIRARAYVRFWYQCL